MIMEINRALDQISEIHQQLAKTEVYREFRAIPVSVSGILGFLAAFLQPHIISPEQEFSFIIYWSGVAFICLIVAGGGIFYNYLRQQSEIIRRQTRIVVSQFIPCLLAGVLITLAISKLGILSIAILPGLWACLFSLGIFAARPYLPRATGWIGLFYLVAGSILLTLAERGGSLSPWGMGITFGFGQFASGFVLYWDLERKKNV